MAGDEEWRKMANTHKMKPEDVKVAGVEGSESPPDRTQGKCYTRGATFHTAIKPWPSVASLLLLPLDIPSCMSRKSLKPLPKMLARLLLESPNPKTLTLGSSSSRSSGSIILVLAMKVLLLMS